RTPPPTPSARVALLRAGRFASRGRPTPTRAETPPSVLPDRGPSGRPSDVTTPPSPLPSAAAAPTRATGVPPAAPLGHRADARGAPATPVATTTADPAPGCRARPTRRCRTRT